MSNTYGLSSVRRFCKNSEFCGDSGFCCIPQKSVNFLPLAGNPLGQIKRNCLLGCSSNQFRSFILRAYVVHGFSKNVGSLYTEFGDLPFWSCLLLDSSSLLSSDCAYFRLCPLVLQTTKNGFLRGNPCSQPTAMTVTCP